MSVGLGYGNSASEDPGLGLGFFGMLQLGRSSGSTIGIPLALATFNAHPESASLFLSGIHIGRVVYVQGLAGVVNGTKDTSGLVYDPTQGLVGTTQHTSVTAFGVALAFGLSLELSNRLALNGEILAAKGIGTDGITGGFLVGPTLLPWGARK